MKTTHTPGPVWAGPYKPHIAEDGTAFLLGAVHQAHECGCKVIGNGTLPNPLAVELCPMHKAAPKLLKQSERIITKLLAGGYNHQMGKFHRLAGELAKSARAAIARAEGN